MVEKECTGNVTKGQMLKDALDRIRVRVQSKFEKPLEVVYHEPDLEGYMPLSGESPTLYLVEVSKSYWLYIIPRKRYQVLVAIDVDVLEERQTKCKVYEPSLHSIVEEELGQCAPLYTFTFA